ncbi:hypothetical protein H2199_005825 [Coniosporium tulheliwenetii]|uniref:Uncharacterized protein n=1 Tax=Coniosporium tulheliwenetii TaxID=3383036 RepID=A0ACC2YZ64_9PEZI|nr:hypothetical protein H2199_005825 [Cladosporium sp. JES 115]
MYEMTMEEEPPPVPRRLGQYPSQVPARQAPAQSFGTAPRPYPPRRAPVPAPAYDPPWGAYGGPRFPARAEPYPYEQEEYPAYGEEQDLAYEEEDLAYEEEYLPRVPQYLPQATPAPVRQRATEQMRTPAPAYQDVPAQGQPLARAPQAPIVPTGPRGASQAQPQSMPSWADRFEDPAVDELAGQLFEQRSGQLSEGWNVVAARGGNFRDGVDSPETRQQFSEALAGRSSGLDQSMHAPQNRQQPSSSAAAARQAPLQAASTQQPPKAAAKPKGPVIGKPKVNTGIATSGPCQGEIPPVCEHWEFGRIDNWRKRVKPLQHDYADKQRAKEKLRRDAEAAPKHSAPAAAKAGPSVAKTAQPGSQAPARSDPPAPSPPKSTVVGQQNATAGPSGTGQNRETVGAPAQATKKVSAEGAKKPAEAPPEPPKDPEGKGRKAETEEEEFLGDEEEEAAEGEQSWRRRGTRRPSWSLLGLVGVDPRPPPALRLGPVGYITGNFE